MADNDSSLRSINIKIDSDNIENIGKRIDQFLTDSKELELSRSQIQKYISENHITLNGSPVSKNHKLRNKDEILIELPEIEISHLEPENIPLEIVFEDEYLAVVNKPAGMVTHPGTGVKNGTLVNALLYHLKELAKSTEPERPGIVHRLDKLSSGLLVVAKKPVVFRQLQKMIQEREIKRTYLALICGHMTENEGTIDLPIGRSSKDRKKMAITKHNSRQAISHYKLLKRYRTYDLLEVTLETGRTHQIRVHLAYLGHPVFGDQDYGGREQWHKGIFGPEKPLGIKSLKLLDRQALHACKLAFVHPVTKKEMELTAEIPSDMQEVLDLLELEGS